MPNTSSNTDVDPILAPLESDKIQPLFKDLVEKVQSAPKEIKDAIKENPSEIVAIFQGIKPSHILKYTDEARGDGGEVQKNQLGGWINDNFPELRTASISMIDGFVYNPTVLEQTIERNKDLVSDLLGSKEDLQTKLVDSLGTLDPADPKKQLLLGIALGYTAQDSIMFALERYDKGFFTAKQMQDLPDQVLNSIDEYNRIKEEDDMWQIDLDDFSYMAYGKSEERNSFVQSWKEGVKRSGAYRMLKDAVNN